MKSPDPHSWPSAPRKHVWTSSMKVGDGQRKIICSWCMKAKDDG